MSQNSRGNILCLNNVTSATQVFKEVLKTHQM